MCWTWPTQTKWFSSGIIPSQIFLLFFVLQHSGVFFILYLSNDDQHIGQVYILPPDIDQLSYFSLALWSSGGYIPISRVPRQKKLTKSSKTRDRGAYFFSNFCQISSWCDITVVVNKSTWSQPAAGAKFVIPERLQHFSCQNLSRKWYFYHAIAAKSENFPRPELVLGRHLISSGETLDPPHHTGVPPYLVGRWFRGISPPMANTFMIVNVNSNCDWP